jgi:hypothetical protein
MPRTVLNCQGISERRERVEAAVEAAAQRLAQPFEAWIAATRSVAASGFSSPGRGASKGRSRSRSSERRRRLRSVGGSEPGLKRAGRVSAAKQSAPAEKAVGRTKAAPRRPARGEGARQEGCGAGDGGGWERAGRHSGIVGAARNVQPGTALPTTPFRATRPMPAEAVWRSKQPNREGSPGAG